MKVDRFTKAVLTGIFLCLVLLTLKEYDIISDAEAAKAGITNVNIARIDGNSLPSEHWKGKTYSFIPVKQQATLLNVHNNSTQSWYKPMMKSDAVGGKVLFRELVWGR